MGTLLRSCAEVCEPIELLFRKVSGVTPGIHVLDGDPRASRGTGGFWSCLSHWPNGFNGVFCNRNAFNSCVKSWYFHTDNTSLESMFHWLSEDVLKFEVDAGFENNWQKCNS